MSQWVLGCVVAVLLVGTGTARAATPSPAPWDDQAWPCEAPTRLETKSRALQRALEKKLVGAGLWQHVRRHRLSVAVVDLSQAERLYYAGVNDNEMMYAASLPKIAILLAVAQAAHDGTLVWTREHEERLASMIVESSNPNAVWGAERVGLTGIAEVVRSPKYCLYDNVHGGLWVGKHYGPGAATLRDPLEGLSHAATARQAARFYAMLARGELVSKTWSQRMLSLMAPPKHRHKLVAGLAERPEARFLARKSGTWRQWHSDSALIQHGDARYVVVVMTELRSGERVVQEVARLVDDIITEGAHRPARRPHS